VTPGQQQHPLFGSLSGPTPKKKKLKLQLNSLLRVALTLMHATVKAIFCRIKQDRKATTFLLTARHANSLSVGQSTYCHVVCGMCAWIWPSLCELKRGGREHAGKHSGCTWIWPSFCEIKREGREHAGRHSGCTWIWPSL